MRPEEIRPASRSFFGEKWGRSLFFAIAIALLPISSHGEERFLLLRLENGQSLGFRLFDYAPDAHLLDADKPLEPRSALDTAKLVTRYLAEGRVEEASMLSNAPRARFELMRESFEGWSEEDFRKAYSRYFAPENHIVGEVAIGDHRLLMWYLKDTDHVAGFFLVNVDGRLLLDDVPNPMRANLRRVLEAYRSGKIPEK